MIGGFRRRRPATRLLGSVVLTLVAVAAWQGPAQADKSGPGGAATLVVAKGGDRTAPQAVDTVAGAIFGFYASDSGSPPRNGATPVATCTTTEPSGTCRVQVPGRTGAGRGYWIRELSAPRGYLVIGSLDVGGATTTPTAYNQLFTGPVAGDATYTFPETGAGSSGTVRGNPWADSRVDSPGPAYCGMRLALLLDTSDAVGAELTTVKSAAKALVDTFTGTSTTVGVYQFADHGSLVNNLTALPDAAAARPVKAAIDSLTAGGATNWDAGLWQVAASPVHYDTVLMVTGGNPTAYGPDAEGTGEVTGFRDLESAIYSANALKAKGTFIQLVGVDGALDDSADNVIAISGAAPDEILNRDAPLTTVLRDFARDACRSTVSVIKKIVPPDGDLAGAVPGAGQTIDTRTGNVTPSSVVTGAASGVATFAAPRDRPAKRQPVRLAEVGQPGYEPFPVDGHRATCQRGDGTPVPATDTGTGGFSTTLIPGDTVSCTVYNRVTGAAGPAQVRVDKDWVINGEHDTLRTAPPEFQAALTIVGQDQPVFGQAYGGYLARDLVKIGESVADDLLPPGCTYRTEGDLGLHSLTAGRNVFTLTNVVTCPTAPDQRHDGRTSHHR